MFKGKILSTYYPEEYLNIFSEEHLNFFLTQLDLDNSILIKKSPIYKRDALISFKNKDIVMKEWSVDLFSNFLYSEYPGRPPKQNLDNDILKEYHMPAFPTEYEYSLIDLDIISMNNEKVNKLNNSKKLLNKKDYIKENEKLIRFGDRGEKIVLDFERERLRKAELHELANKVERVSLKSDSFGYDILSFNSDGSKRFIEVKATNTNVDNTKFFISSNELDRARNLKNYYLYIVYNITSKNPKIWIVGNPFNPENNKIQIEPVNFHVSIRTKEK